MKYLVFSVFLCIFVVSTKIIAKNIVCYYGTWSTYRNGNGKFDVSDLDPFICTHLVYAFFGIEQSGDIRIIDPYLDLEENWGRGNIKKFNALKQINPKLKTLAASGGWNEGSLNYSIVSKDPLKRKQFATSVTNFLLKYGFDGFDLDWEYPGQRGGDPIADKENFVLLLKDLKTELIKYNFILSAAVAAAEISAKISYNIPKIFQYLDFVNLMTYDFHGSWEKITGINAPLYGRRHDDNFNVDDSIKYWIKEGAPSDKLMLGIPFYGQTFTLANDRENSVGSLATGPGIPGPYTKQPGILGYNEFCETNMNNRWSKNWEEQQSVPYAYKEYQWIGYDNERSINYKSKYVLENNLGGVMVWSVETDDFRGICVAGVKYPLLKIIETNLRPGSINKSEKIISPNQNTINNNPLFCDSNEFIRDPYDCSLFYRCVNGIIYKFYCPDNLYFDNVKKFCNYKNLVNCSFSNYNAIKLNELN